MICTTKPLEDALGALESALATPVIAGELPQWCEVASHACNEMEICLKTAVRENHTPLIKEIFAIDPEQARHVDQLKQADVELQQHVAAFGQRLVELCDAAVVVEPDEQRIAERVEDTIKSGLDLVISVRRQEMALTTWHSEALKRDRGVVD